MTPEEEELLAAAIIDIYFRLLFLMNHWGLHTDHEHREIYQRIERIHKIHHPHMEVDLSDLKDSSTQPDD